MQLKKELEEAGVKPLNEKELDQAAGGTKYFSKEQAAETKAYWYLYEAGQTQSDQPNGGYF